MEGYLFYQNQPTLVDWPHSYCNSDNLDEIDHGMNGTLKCLLFLNGAYSNEFIKVGNKFIFKNLMQEFTKNLKQINYFYKVVTIKNSVTLE